MNFYVGFMYVSLYCGFSDLQLFTLLATHSTPFLVAMVECSCLTDHADSVLCCVVLLCWSQLAISLVYHALSPLLVHATPPSLSGHAPLSNHPVNYPTSAAEILDLLQEKVAILSGGRDKDGQSVITFPAMPKTYVYQRECIRRIVQYLACIPA